MIDIAVLQRVAATLAERKAADADASYVSSLYEKGTDAICKKVAEECAETIMAAKDGDRLHLVWEVTDAEKLVYEVADLWFHTMVLLSHFGLTLDDVLAEFRRREGVSGIDEKKSRTPQ